MKKRDKALLNNASHNSSTSKEINPVVQGDNNTIIIKNFSNEQQKYENNNIAEQIDDVSLTHSASNLSALPASITPSARFFELSTGVDSPPEIEYWVGRIDELRRLENNFKVTFITGLGGQGFRIPWPEQ